MRKKLLLEVAFEKFSQKGYGATLSEIAEGAGIKKQSIYNHYKDKDDLIYKVVEVELNHFYSTKSDEFDGYMHLDAEIALRTMFFSICDYYTNIDKLKFVRWIMLIESNKLFLRCRDLIRVNERQLYSRVKFMLDKTLKDRNVDEDVIWSAVQTFVVMIHGVLDGILLYQNVYDPKTLIENAWRFYWNGIEGLK